MNLFDLLKEMWWNKDHKWVETTVEMFYDQLNCVPPLKMCNNIFMEGECWDMDDNGDIYTVFYKEKDRCFARHVYEKDWSPVNFTQEIMKQFYEN